MNLQGSNLQLLQILKAARRFCILQKWEEESFKNTLFLKKGELLNDLRNHIRFQLKKYRATFHVVNL